MSPSVRSRLRFRSRFKNLVAVKPQAQARENQIAAQGMGKIIHDDPRARGGERIGETCHTRIAAHEGGKELKIER